MPRADLAVARDALSDRPVLVAGERKAIPDLFGVRSESRGFGRLARPAQQRRSADWQRLPSRTHFHGAVE